MNDQIAVHHQIMWNRLIAVVEEQAVTLMRTAFCTSVREAGDLSAGVFDRQGRMVAQAVTGTPGHVNSMAESVAHFTRLFGDGRLQPGDVLVTNDPWMGTGHLHDITVVTPVFRPHDGAPRLIGYFASTAHVVDIGGRGFGELDAGQDGSDGRIKGGITGGGFEPGAGDAASVVRPDADLVVEHCLPGERIPAEGIADAVLHFRGIPSPAAGSLGSAAAEAAASAAAIAFVA